MCKQQIINKFCKLNKLISQKKKVNNVYRICKSAFLRKKQNKNHQ